MLEKLSDSQICIKLKEFYFQENLRKKLIEVNLNEKLFLLLQNRIMKNARKIISIE